VTGTAIAFACVAAPRDAAAHGGKCDARCIEGFARAVAWAATTATTVDFDTRASRYFTAPPLTRPGPYAWPGVRLSPGPVSLVGMGLDLAYVDGHLVLPMLGAGIAAPLGGDGAAYTDARLSSFYTFTFLMPGIGYRSRAGSWSFTAVLRTALTNASGSGRYTDGLTGLDMPFSSSALTFALRADLQACGQIDEKARVCAFVAPNVYEYEWGNGGAIGLRLEAGR
jgi:hypothetical protein